MLIEKHIFDFIYLMTVKTFDLFVTLLRHSESKCACHWSRQFEWVKTKSKYINGKPICDFIFDGDCNVNAFTVFDIFTVEMCTTLHWSLEGPRSNVDKPSKRSYAIFSLLAVVMFVISVTVYKIFIFEMCTTLTLTFIMGEGQDQMQICQSTGCDFTWVGNGNVCPICHRWRDNQLWIFHCTWFIFFTLKMKSRALTIQWKLARELTYQRTYVCNNWRF